MGSLYLPRHPVRPAVLRRPVVLRRTTVLTSSLQDQQIIKAAIDVISQRRDVLIQQLPVDGPVSRDVAAYLDALERALNANRHALDALSNYQTVNDAWIATEISRQDFGGKGYGIGPTWAPPASAVVTGQSYDKGAGEVGPRFTPQI